MRTVEYELMRPPEIAQARARLPLAFIPIGPLEWHGPHLPMGMDGLHAHPVAMEVSTTCGRCSGSRRRNRTRRGCASSSRWPFYRRSRPSPIPATPRRLRPRSSSPPGPTSLTSAPCRRKARRCGIGNLGSSTARHSTEDPRQISRSGPTPTPVRRPQILVERCWTLRSRVSPPSSRSRRRPWAWLQDAHEEWMISREEVLHQRTSAYGVRIRPETVTAWSFLLPTVLLLLVLAVYPLIYAFFLSMTDAQVSGPVHFVGVRNFIRLLRTAIFTLTLSNTVWYTLAAVTAKLALGLALALVLAQRAPGMRWIRGAVLIPWVVPTSLAMLAWTWMFDSTYSVINWVLMHVGMINGPIAWLGTPRLARFAVVLVNVWSGLPFFGINFLAGLVTIPQELYEAATVDGAGSLVRFRRVTLPLLRPVLATVLLFSVVMTSSDFATIFVLTKGGPQNTTQILSTLAYKLGLATGDLGNAAAISLYLFPVLAVSTYVQVRLMRRVWQW